MDNTPAHPESAEPQSPTEVVPVQRPWSVTLLALGVLIITVLNLTRFALSLGDWSFLSAQPGISPYYLAISGFIWTVAGGFMVWGLWTAKTWAPRLMQAVALTYALYYWLDLLFLKDHPLNGKSNALYAVLPTNWQFSAGVTVLCLAYMLWALGRPKVKAYFLQVEPAHSPEPEKDAPGQAS
jgi:hypothetical protein